MKALIKDGFIIQITKEPFDVHPDFKWIDCPDECDLSWSYNNGKLISPIEIKATNQEMRSKLLPSTDQKVQLIWDAIIANDYEPIKKMNVEINDIHKQYPIEAL